MQATSTIYIGLQLLLPGETAPAHKHTPSAARIVVEGEGAYTVVDGEKLPMHAGRSDPDAGRLLARSRPRRQGAGGLARCARPAAVRLPGGLLRHRGAAADAAQPPRCLRGRVSRRWPRAGAPPRPRRARRLSDDALSLGAHRGGTAPARRAQRRRGRRARLRQSRDRPELPADHGLHGHDAAPGRDAAPAAALRQRRVPRRQRPRQLGDQRRHAHVGSQGHVLGAGVRQRSSTRRPAASRPSWCASTMRPCRRSSATTRSARDEHDWSGISRRAGARGADRRRHARLSRAPHLLRRPQLRRSRQGDGLRGRSRGALVLHQARQRDRASGATIPYRRRRRTTTTRWSWWWRSARRPSASRRRTR